MSVGPILALLASAMGGYSRRRGELSREEIERKRQAKIDAQNAEELRRRRAEEDWSPGSFFGGAPTGPSLPYDPRFGEGPLFGKVQSALMPPIPAGEPGIMTATPLAPPVNGFRNVHPLGGPPAATPSLQPQDYMTRVPPAPAPQTKDEWLNKLAQTPGLTQWQYDAILKRINAMPSDEQEIKYKAAAPERVAYVRNLMQRVAASFPRYKDMLEGIDLTGASDADLDRITQWAANLSLTFERESGAGTESTGGRPKTGDRPKPGDFSFNDYANGRVTTDSVPPIGPAPPPGSPLGRGGVGVEVLPPSKKNFAPLPAAPARGTGAAPPDVPAKITGPAMPPASQQAPPPPGMNSRDFFNAEYSDTKKLPISEFSNAVNALVRAAELQGSPANTPVYRIDPAAQTVTFLAGSDGQPVLFTEKQAIELQKTLGNIAEKNVLPPANKVQQRGWSFYPWAGAIEKGRGTARPWYEGNITVNEGDALPAGIMPFDMRPQPFVNAAGQTVYKTPSEIAALASRSKADRELAADKRAETVTISGPDGKPVQVPALDWYKQTRAGGATGDKIQATLKSGKTIMVTGNKYAELEAAGALKGSIAVPKSLSAKTLIKDYSYPPPDGVTPWESVGGTNPQGMFNYLMYTLNKSGNEVLPIARGIYDELKKKSPNLSVKAAYRTIINELGRGYGLLIEQYKGYL